MKADYGTVAPGQKLELLCQGCFKVWFPWVTTSDWYAHVPAYHSRRCQERSRRGRKKATTYVKCPRPEKVLYRTHKAASAEAILLGQRYQQPFSIYSCSCGGLHVGRVPYRRQRG